MLAHRIEQRLSKDQILGIYLNHVYLGHGAYGDRRRRRRRTSARTWPTSRPPRRPCSRACPRRPGRATPFHDFARAQARQHYVIDQMQELGFLTPAQAETARHEALVLVSRERNLTNVAAPYFVETIRRHVADNYGDEELLERGLRVYTTLDMRKQRVAEAALRAGLEDLQRRIGFSGPIAHLDADQRRRLLRGRPRPFGPTGYLLDDEEQDDHLLMGEPPGRRAHRRDDARRGRAPARAHGQVRRRRGLGRAPQGGRRGAAQRAPRQRPRFPVDPDTTYAAVVTAVGKKITLASGGLSVGLEAADEARLAASETRAARVEVGDVLPVRFRSVPDGKKAQKLVAALATAPEIQGALIALDPANGHLVSMVGGYDYGKSQFNRAVQAHRQIGSAMKPFIYATAIDHGMNELTIKYDAPVKFKTASGVWAPHNYKRDYLGPLTLRTAIAKSVNTVSAQLVAQMGVDSVIETMRKLGIRSSLPHALSLALGTADLTLEEVAYGLATFPAGGEEVTPVFITKLTDADGHVLEQHDDAAPGRARAGSRPRRPTS